MFRFRSEERREQRHARLAARHLAELQPGHQPYDLFKQASRLFMQPVVELTLFRQGSDGPEVLLTQRSEDDEFWPGEWHVPGAVMLATDDLSRGNGYHDPIGRILHNELDGSLEITKGPFEIGALPKAGPRGHGISVLHWAEVAGEPAVGPFFNAADVVRNPPEGGLVEGHDSLIGLGVIARGAAL